MLCTEIVSDIQNKFCTQHVLSMFCKERSFWQRFTCHKDVKTEQSFQESEEKIESENFDFDFESKDDVNDIKPKLPDGESEEIPALEIRTDLNKKKSKMDMAGSSRKNKTT